MNLSTPVSPFLEHFTKPQKTPHLPIISAKYEALIIQFNALVKVQRTKKFRELHETNYAAWLERLEIYQDVQEGLYYQLERMVREHGTIHIWDGVV
jgi:ribosome maturation protein Sdo1